MLEPLQVPADRWAEVPLEERCEKRHRTVELDLSGVAKCDLATSGSTRRSPLSTKGPPMVLKAVFRPGSNATIWATFIMRMPAKAAARRIRMLLSMERLSSRWTLAVAGRSIQQQAARWHQGWGNARTRGTLRRSPGQDFWRPSCLPVSSLLAWVWTAKRPRSNADVIPDVGGRPAAWTPQHRAATRVDGHRHGEHRKPPAATHTSQLFGGSLDCCASSSSLSQRFWSPARPHRARIHACPGRELRDPHRRRALHGRTGRVR